MTVMTLVVIVLAALIVIGGITLVVILTARGSARSTAAPVRVPPPPLPAEASAQIESLLLNGQQIQAIKVYRDYTRLGLAESKAAIDHWQFGAPPGAQPQGPVGGPADDPRWAEVERGARSIAATEGKIPAIKWVREQTGLGLAEAKNVVDRLG